MKPASTTAQGVLEQRWERLGLGVRCAWNAQRPEVLQQYVQAGRRLSRLQPEREASIQRRMLDLLLHTAADEALPWPWRAACLEHTVWPLARLTSLLNRLATAAADAPAAREALARLQQRLQQLGAQLGLPPACGSAGGGARLRSPGGPR